MNYTLLNLLILLCSLQIFLDVLQTVTEYIKLLPFSDLKAEHSEAEETASEVSDDCVEYRPRYDVEGFKIRMSKLRDEDGLQEVSQIPLRTDFTGTEILTENYELELDKKLRR